ncbi:lipid-transfer protein [Striga asiatica]|uniref:Lipid-transfer protein n=1 Tax=Striga asiatica TaxID=4170 RepID=A0A5A7PEG3_STRAF|nr:lipid-transfer protein [Striga asiatica]
MNQILRLFLLLTLTSAFAAAAQTPTAACSDRLVTFSTCLPYVAAAPNNLTSSPPPSCCNEVSAAFGDGSADCLCYMVRRPDFLGFPLNSTKLMSLTSVCPLKKRNSTASFSLEKLCSGPVALPPLGSITGFKNPAPLNFGAISAPPSLSRAPAEESIGSSSPKDPAADKVPSRPRFSTNSANISSAARTMCRLSGTWLSFPLYILLTTV